MSVRRTRGASLLGLPVSVAASAHTQVLYVFCPMFTVVLGVCVTVMQAVLSRMHVQKCFCGKITQNSPHPFSGGTNSSWLCGRAGRRADEGRSMAIHSARTPQADRVGAMCNV